MIRPPDPPLGDGVVALRPWRKDDVAVLPGLINGDPEIERWLELMPSPYTKRDAREWVARATEAWRSGQFLPFAVLDAETRAGRRRPRLQLDRRSTAPRARSATG